MLILRDWSNRFSNNNAPRGRFSIGNGHGFESILRGAMDFECQPSRVRDRSRDEMPKMILVVQEIFRP